MIRTRARPPASESLSLAEARRTALAAQGFDRPRPGRRPGAPELRRVVRQLGLLQIDYVNVLVPAQYQVPFSRLGAYDVARLDDLVYRRREFTEQWAHEASIVPAESWPLLRWRAEGTDRRSRALSRFMKRHAPYLSRVLELVRERGPLPAETVPEPDGTKGRRRGEFWAWTRAKAALEAHFARGTLAIAGRRRAGFARMYDLAARVLPPQHHRRDVARHEAQRDLLRQSARALGVGTEADLADYFRMPIREARPRIAELEEAGELHPARVEGWRERALLFRGAVVAPRVAACALLSPFDPVVWHRPRTQRLFGFDYRLEIWVPRARRRWGYYVLPFLLDDRLVARVDLKADRAGGRLLVPSAYVEPGVDERRTADALAAELGAMAGWLGLESVAVERRNAFSRRLAAAVRRRGR